MNAPISIFGNTMNPIRDFNQIPVIDLSRWRGGPSQRAQLVDEVSDICHHIGFLQVINHGIEPGFMANIFDMMERLFSLPEEQKRAIDKANSRHFRGWEAVGSEYTNNQPDIREQVDIWSEMAAREIDIEPAYLRLLGPNQWFDESVLPGYRDLVLTWMAKASALGDQLLEILSVGLGLDPSHLKTLFGQDGMSLTKLIHYPATPAGSAGVNPHHDTGFLTILDPGSTPGLEVKNAASQWVPVPYVEGSFVINLGEMLQAITGNYFVATPHRVITPKERMSIGFFYGPSLDIGLDLLPLESKFFDAVTDSPRHATAGFMASRTETRNGVGEMQSHNKPNVYGEQLWNYFARSYPQIFSKYYGPNRS